MYVQPKKVMDHRGFTIRECVPVEDLRLGIYHDFSALFIKRDNHLFIN